MARGTEWGETQSALAHADVTREEAQVIARTALQNATYGETTQSVGSGGGRG